MVRSKSSIQRVLTWLKKTCCCRRLCCRNNKEVTSSKERSLTREIDDLKVFIHFSYPVNIYKHLFHEEDAECKQKVDELGENRNWDELVSYLKTAGGINSSRLPIEDEPNSLASLYTPLHHAAAGKAPKHVFEDLLKMGASKCLKTSKGDTAFEIALTNSLDEDILRLIEVPESVKQNGESIAIMEQSLHTVILDRVERLIQNNGQQLPQLAFLYEKGPFHYSVPMMYGGFNVKKYNDGIKVHSFCRVVGGSEKDHVIDRNGNITLVATGYPF
ncbi:unnamed protein product [Mytilus coruscus]|uniref:Uncharacterized protein n=1 Tax=Mytilus coruscus TaxID=42192 RepID=A0A6J8D002_MYTCO|nr:unnamed protein product [Mytilus coruscus]